MRQLGGNLLLLVPLGFLLPLASPRFRQFRKTVAVAVMVSLGIEMLQLTISTVVGFPYRVFDVDDLILNTAGAAVGWAGWSSPLDGYTGHLAKHRGWPTYDGAHAWPERP